MKNIAIIPARGGSKRILRKNIKLFMGRPIIAYSIEVALQSKLFDEVMVSTDDDEIAKIAKEYGAKVPFMRSTETANDFAPLSSVVDEVLMYYSNNGFYFDNFCCILATAPLLTTCDLTEAYNLLSSSDFDTIRPVIKFSYPIQRAFRLNDSNSVEWFSSEFSQSRSQDLEPAYHDAGLFYWGISSAGLESLKRGAIVIPEHRCQDIDTEEDWKIAEYKYKVINGFDI